METFCQANKRERIFLGEETLFLFSKELKIFIEIRKRDGEFNLRNAPSIFSCSFVFTIYSKTFTSTVNNFRKSRLLKF